MLVLKLFFNDIFFHRKSITFVLHSLTLPISMKFLFRLVWKSALWFIILSVFSVLMFRIVPVPVTPLMLLRSIEQKLNGKPMRVEHNWVSMSHIPNCLQLAVVCSEDQHFMVHHGIDWDAIEDAMKYNDRKKGKRVRGGSTISQQTAKNIYLLPGQSLLVRYARKGFELYFTMMMEFVYPKRRIMEIYLNSIEMGDGIYGVEAIARSAFGKSADQLSAADCALIAASLPNPRRFDVAHPSAYMLKRQSSILRQMNNYGRILEYSKDDVLQCK